MHLRNLYGFPNTLNGESKLLFRKYERFFLKLINVTNNQFNINRLREELCLKGIKNSQNTNDWTPVCICVRQFCSTQSFQQKFVFDLQTSKCHLGLRVGTKRCMRGRNDYLIIYKDLLCSGLLCLKRFEIKTEVLDETLTPNPKVQETLVCDKKYFN